MVRAVAAPRPGRRVPVIRARRRTRPPQLPPETNLLAASAPVAAQPFQVARLPRGVASEERLQVKTIWAARAIGVLFPQIKTIWGYRRDRCRGTRTGSPLT